MSADALPTPPTDHSLLYRMSYTPLRDALRGRWTTSLDYRRALAAAGLPAALDALVRQVVEKTGLWRREKVDVARELIAHFRDGLDRGAEPEKLIVAFGNLAIAVKLIR